MKVFTQVKAYRQGLCLAGTDSVHQESCLGREEEARLGEEGGCWTVWWKVEASFYLPRKESDKENNGVSVNSTVTSATPLKLVFYPNFLEDIEGMLRCYPSGQLGGVYWGWASPIWLWVDLIHSHSNTSLSYVGRNGEKEWGTLLSSVAAMSNTYPDFLFVREMFPLGTFDVSVSDDGEGLKTLP